MHKPETLPMCDVHDTTETSKLIFVQIRGGAGGDDRLSALCASMSRWAAERGSSDDISLVCVELSAADWNNPNGAYVPSTSESAEKANEELTDAIQKN